MGLTARQRRVFDKDQSIGKSTEDAKKESDKNVYSRAKERLKDYKAGKLGRIAKLKRRAKELIGGEKTYISKERHQEMIVARKKKKAKPKGSRTKTVESGMAAAGLTKEEIARFGGR